ncbi:MAG: hypothetical protein LBR20_00320 [Propionibacteriaceae bacterium]|jgi:hypothetical protein|nr:hypothetical protein [Propionibacteriaceae bacterium]
MRIRNIAIVSLLLALGACATTPEATPTVTVTETATPAPAPTVTVTETATTTATPAAGDVAAVKTALESADVWKENKLGEIKYADGYYTINVTPTDKKWTEDPCLGDCNKHFSKLTSDLIQAMALTSTNLGDWVGIKVYYGEDLGTIEEKLECVNKWISEQSGQGDDPCPDIKHFGITDAADDELAGND